MAVELARLRAEVEALKADNAELCSRLREIRARRENEEMLRLDAVTRASKAEADLAAAGVEVKELQYVRELGESLSLTAGRVLDMFKKRAVAQNWTLGDKVKAFNDACGRLKDGGSPVTDELQELREDLSAAGVMLAKKDEALKELLAVVRGECPALLNEDSGGNARLDAACDEALSPSKPRAQRIAEALMEAYEASKAARQINSDEAITILDEKLEAVQREIGDKNESMG
jgi:hypothetical protein